jgi:hypothetical protein
VNPLYAAQDFEIKDFSVVLVSEQKDSAEVAASIKNMGTSEKIVFLLSNTAQGWRITDIKYSDGERSRNSEMRAQNALSNKKNDVITCPWLSANIR